MSTSASADAPDGGLSERAFAALRDDIVRARLEPGARLRIEELRSTYGLGSTPLREALSRLCEIGLVEANWQRGFRVAPVSQRDLADVTEMRINLEVQALRESMRNGDARWEAGVVGSHHTLAAAEKLLPSRTDESYDAYERANREFHDALVSACGSRWTLRFRDQIYDHHERYRRISMLVAPRRANDVRREHKLIKEAAIERNVDRACEYARKHVLGNVEAIASSLPA
jgi:DNA-binding GntR family transcriptional regulator